MAKTGISFTLFRIRKVFNYLFFLPLVTFMIYAGVMAFLSVQQKSKLLSTVLAESKYHNEHWLASRDTGFYALVCEEAFLKSREAMVSEDSACLTIDLKNKMASIELQGVQVHKCPIDNIKYDKLIASTDKFYRAKEFSFPHTIDSSYASISKQTFVVKNAPKDTSQNPGTVALPDTNAVQPVFFSLFLSNGFIINASQQDEGGSFSYYKFELMRRLLAAKYFIADICRLKIPEYRPQIYIEMPARDARTFYKALPATTLVTLRIV